MRDCRTVLVTGGSRGIGRAICLAVARLGCAVMINYRANQAAAEETLRLIEDAGGQGRIAQADIGRSDERERLVTQTVEAFGRIDVLVNNAAVSTTRRQDMLEDAEADFQAVLTTNLVGPHFLAQRVARVMIEQMESGGSLVEPVMVNISSISAYAVTTHRAAYCVAKAGLSMVTSLYATRLAEYGIRVFEIRPGVIRTDMTAPVAELYEQRIADGLSPIARWGEPDDVAAAVAAIVEGRLPFSTGEVINVDGGFHLRRL